MQDDIRTDVDFVLTYEELMGIFEARDIDFSQLPDSPDLDEGTRAGRGFAGAGGVAAAVKEAIGHMDPSREVPIEYGDGLRECRKMLMMAKAGKRNGFVDVPMLEATRPGDRLTLDFRGKAIGIFCVSGPSAGILEYSVDGAPFKELDTFTEWSHNLYIPWVYMLETELKDTDHKLVLRISKKKNPASQGTECQIRNFVVNGR